MEPNDPISKLAMCCLGRRPRSGGFRTEALRNQYYYSPSMAHIGPGNTTTWPMAQAFAPAPFGLAAPSQPQPYILFTQPMIISNDPVNSLGQPQAMARQTIPMVGAQQASPLHKVPSMAASQYAIHANSIYTAGGVGPPGAMCTTQAIYAPNPQFASATIYETPNTLNGLSRARGACLDPIAEALVSRQLQQREQQRQYAISMRQGQPRPRGLGKDIYKQLEVVEKQVDLTRDMDLVERHGLVITRAIEARSLAPLLTEETLRRYQEHFLMSDDYVIRFIEIIKRPGQTLGLYIRLVHFQTQELTGDPREGIVITKIESNSPVYTSQVLHIGDEILSVNLIDIQGMSLDDVVTLMSIPKRLVLALRVPRGRDGQLKATYALNQHQYQPTDECPPPGAKRVDDDDGELECAQRARSATRQLIQRQEQQQQQQQRTAMRMGFEQSAGQLAIANHLGNQNCPSGGDQIRELNQLMTPSRNQPGPQVDSRIAAIPQEADRHRFSSPDRGGEQLIMRPSDFMSANRSLLRAQKNIQPADELLAQTSSILDNETPEKIGPQSRLSLVNGQAPRSYEDTIGEPRLPSGHREQQMSREERARSVSDRFRNFSVDNEIASLEREAMNKADVDQPISFSEHHITSAGASNATAPQEPNTLPRRTLPSPPNLGSQDVVERELTALSSRRPIINNIRLGDTSEQSSYFSSSIDAINRELKELRRQRMALGDDDASVVVEETAQDLYR